MDTMMKEGISDHILTTSRMLAHFCHVPERKRRQVAKYVEVYSDCDLMSDYFSVRLGSVTVIVIDNRHPNHTRIKSIEFSSNTKFPADQFDLWRWAKDLREIAEDRPNLTVWVGEQQNQKPYKLVEVK